MELCASSDFNPMLATLHDKSLPASTPTDVGHVRTKNPNVPVKHDGIWTFEQVIKCEFMRAEFLGFLPFNQSQLIFQS